MVLVQRGESTAADSNSTGEDEGRLQEDVFSAIVGKYSGYAYIIAWRILRNHQDAEDAVQEAFISAYLAFPKFRGDSNVSTWLYRIVVNACLLKIRRNKTRKRVHVEIGDSDSTAFDSASANEDISSDPERFSAHSELQDILEDELSRLPSPARSAVILRDLYGYNNEDAANVMEISVSALKSRLHRGRNLLRKRLGENPRLKPNL